MGKVDVVVGSVRHRFFGCGAASSYSEVDSELTLPTSDVNKDVIISVLS